MSEPIFHAKLLSNYQLVTKPGTYYVSAAYTTTEANLIADEHPRYLVSLRALTSENLLVLIKILNETPIVPFVDVRHLFLTGALWDKSDFSTEDLPIKGEKVLATFDNVETDFGIRLLCTHIELLPREELNYVDITQFDTFLTTINSLITKSIVT